MEGRYKKRTMYHRSELQKMKMKILILTNWNRKKMLVQLERQRRSNRLCNLPLGSLKDQLKTFSEVARLNSRRKTFPTSGERMGVLCQTLIVPCSQVSVEPNLFSSSKYILS